MGELVAGGLLSPGMVLTARYKGVDHEAHVAADGSLLVAGQIYTTPSAAALSIVQKPVNGWTFWRAEHEGRKVPVGSLRDELD